MKPTATTYAKIIQRYSLPAVHSHSIESNRISLFHTPPYLSYPSSHRNSLHTSCSYFLMQLSFRSIIHFRTDSGETGKLVIKDLQWGTYSLVEQQEQERAHHPLSPHDSLSEASTFIEVIEKRQGLKVACLEEIAFKQGWIDKEQLLKLAQPMLKNSYGQYLKELAASR